MAVMTSLHGEQCCSLVNEHTSSSRVASTHAAAPTSYTIYSTLYIRTCR